MPPDLQLCLLYCYAYADNVTSINYVDKQGGGGVGSPKYQGYHISFVNEGGREVKNPQNSVNVVYVCPLSHVFPAIFTARINETCVCG